MDVRPYRGGHAEATFIDVAETDAGTGKDMFVMSA